MRSTGIRNVGKRGRFAALLAAAATAAAGTAMSLVVGGGSSHAAIVVGNPSARADDGSYVTDESVVDDHMGELSIFSVAMRTTVHVRIILPASWYSSPSKTYPALYLLSGSSADNQDWRDWTGSSPIESFMQNRDVLTVMPQDGNAGWYSNWLNSSLQFPGKPQWETFHTVELPQLLARGYRANGTNAIAGVSEASVGVINYSAGHPGLFKAAASFSGMMNTEDSGSIATVQASEVRALDLPGGPWGDPVLNRSVWDAHNPMHNIAGLAANGVKVWICAGNGYPGPTDTGGFKIDSYVYEQAALSQNKAFLSAAQKAGVSITSDFYGNGDHDWPSWVRAFPNAWSTTLAPALGVPA